MTSVGGVFNGDLGDDVLQVDYITTGGFSSLKQHTIQPWQTHAVSNWLETKGERPSKFNSSRRCTPDLSMYDAGYYVTTDGSESPIGGTSAAAPTLAGMISLINDALLLHKKPPLGFLNYFLYQNQQAFKDITHGGNNGFDATVGYDPASGLGTFGPSTFSKLRAAALAHKPVLVPKHAHVPTLLVGLSHSEQTTAELKRKFWAVAEGAESQIRNLDDMANLVGASEDTRLMALVWLESIGCDMTTVQVSNTKDSLQVLWPSGTAQARAPKPPVGSNFSEYILLKRPGPSHIHNTHLTQATHAQDEGMGPESQKDVYGVPLDLKGTNVNNTQMVFGTGTFGYREDDLELFFNTYSKSSSVKDVSFDKSNVWKGQTGKNFVEGELDASYIAAMAPGVKTLVANTNTSAATESGEAFGGALLSFLVELNDRQDLPHVLSM